MKRMIVSAVTLFFVSIVTPSLFLTACAVITNQPPAPPQQQALVENFQLDDNVSRVHIFNSYGSAIELYINDVKIGLLGNNKEYMAIDLNPGIYDFKWIGKSTGDGMLKPIPLHLSVAKSQLLFLKAKFGSGAIPSPEVGQAGVYSRQQTAPPAPATQRNIRGMSNAQIMIADAQSRALASAIADSRESHLITYFEQDPNMKNHIQEYKLILLDEDMKKSLSK